VNEAASITLRPAERRDAAAIGAVFDAAGSAGWSYLGNLAAEPMFTSEDWEQFEADHQPPNLCGLRPSWGLVPASSWRSRSRKRSSL
jgi:hypothetical protein